ncbi:MAG: NAD-dependent epimerase/dehydratase family protein [Thermoleophilia bacterium]|nr:NAD-dependent epimerase/dehydratase family protein [Thermoleophilia bacterium]
MFASSGCVYPEDLQTDPDEVFCLTKDLVKPPYNADNLYRWAKLMAKLTLRAYHAEGRMNTASLRHFTAFGPRCRERHAVMAMIARAMTRQKSGTGEQVRTRRKSRTSSRGRSGPPSRSTTNVGRIERTKLVECAREVLSYMEQNPKPAFDSSKPTGPHNRARDLSLCREPLDGEPQIPFRKGLHDTIDWCMSTNDAEAVRGSLEHMLTERQHA